MKERITEAAARLFVRNGYYQTSMDDVAREAGIAKGSLYYHFKNKSQLFCETVTEGIRYFEEQADGIVSGNQNPQKIAESMVALLVGLYTDHENIADMVMAETSAGIDEDVVSEIREAKDHFIAKIASVIDEGMADGSVRSCGSMSAACAMVAYIHTYCRSVRRSGRFDKTAVTAQITALLLKGLLK